MHLCSQPEDLVVVPIKVVNLSQLFVKGVVKDDALEAHFNLAEETVTVGIVTSTLASAKITTW